MSLKRKGKMGISGEIILPENIKGRFVWNGKSMPLIGGKQNISVE